MYVVPKVNLLQERVLLMIKKTIRGLLRNEGSLLKIGDINIQSPPLRFYVAVFRSTPVKTSIEAHR